MDVVNILLALLGISFLIFVHELGHFLVAKRVGIRVETFAIGFQPTIFGWKARVLAIRRGETEYVIGLVPFGGYVKMAGEEREDPRTGAPDEFSSKTPGQRALVLVAGATMNLIFGFLLFLVAFAIGVEFEGTRLGWVQPGGAAWEAGLRPGDRIVSIDGRPKRHFTDLATTISLEGGSGPLEVTYERPASTPGGEPVSATTTVTPRKDRARGIYWIEVRGSISSRIEEVVDDSPAASAGVLPGDEISSVTLLPPRGAPVPLPASWPLDVSLSALVDFLRQEPGSAVELGIHSPAGGETRAVRVEPKWTVNGDPRLGMIRGLPRVSAVRPGSDAAGEFPTQVEVVELDGAPFASLDAGSLLAAAPRSGEVALRFDDGEVRRFDRDRLLGWIAKGDLAIGPPAPRVRTVEPGSAGAALGLLPGDTLLRVGGDSVVERGTPAGSLAEGTEISWVRGGELRSGAVAERAPLGIELASTARIGAVHPGTPAALAGLLPGDFIVRVGDTDIGRWEEIAPALAPRAKSRGAAAVAIRVLRGGAVIDLEATPAVLPSLDEETDLLGLALAPERITLKSTSPLEAIETGWSETKLWGQRIFLMIGALARREERGGGRARGAGGQHRQDGGSHPEPAGGERPPRGVLPISLAVRQIVRPHADEVESGDDRSGESELEGGRGDAGAPRRDHAGERVQERGREQADPEEARPHREHRITRRCGRCRGR